MFQSFRNFVFLFAGFFFCMQTACATASSLEVVSTADPDVVDFVDLDKYLGTWYEIASTPHRFSKGCMATQATYAAGEKGKILVTNMCRKDSFDGSVSQVNGTAKVVDAKTNAKLKVSFFWPFSGDYWVVGLDQNYRWAVVSGPKKKSIWILSRTRQMDPVEYKALLASLSARGFDIARLQITPQPQQ